MPQRDIIVVGASAGGIEALRTLVSTLPADIPAAIFVVLHVAARVVSRHSLNVMAGHDDVYALLPSGYTILFGSTPQEAADLAAIGYRIAADLCEVPSATHRFGQ